MTLKRLETRGKTHREWMPEQTAAEILEKRLRLGDLLGFGLHRDLVWVAFDRSLELREKKDIRRKHSEEVEDQE